MWVKCNRFMFERRPAYGGLARPVWLTSNSLITWSRKSVEFCLYASAALIASRKTFRRKTRPTSCTGHWHCPLLTSIVVYTTLYIIKWVPNILFVPNNASFHFHLIVHCKILCTQRNLSIHAFCMCNVCVTCNYDMLIFPCGVCSLSVRYSIHWIEL